MGRHLIRDVPLFDDYKPKIKPSRRHPMDDPASLIDNAMAPEQVAKLTGPQRQSRVEALVAESHLIVDAAIEKFVTHDNRKLAGIVGLFSGGNDSTVLCHVMLNRMTHLAHANTTIGIEQTRQFVRDTAVRWGLPLLEFKPPKEVDHYRSMVLAHGFPGPGHHYKMYSHLKQRGLREVRRALVTSRDQRVLFLAGRRRTESARRASVVAAERENTIVWVSPMVNWTKLDLNYYRILVGDVPVNEVSDLIHMSGECLCGSFAHRGELQEIEAWFPEVVAEIRELEAALRDREDIAPERRVWGWSTNYAPPLEESGPLCSSCDWRFEQQMTIDDVALPRDAVNCDGNERHVHE